MINSPSASEFRALLGWMMCSDPFPQGVDKEEVENYLNYISRGFGYTDWIVAYHYF